MEYNIFKYSVCWSFEKLHRYVFDNLFICYSDPKYKPLSIGQKIILVIYKVLFRFIYKDWREYLNYWHLTQKSKYLRYKQYDKKHI